MKGLLNTLPFLTCRNYARITAIALIVLGLLGLTEVIDWASPASFFHVMLGMLYGGLPIPKSRGTCISQGIGRVTSGNQKRYHPCTLTLGRISP